MIIKELAIRCLRSVNEPKKLADAAASLPSSFDWEDFIKIVKQNRIAPLLYYYSLGTEIFPEPVKSTLHKEYLINVWRNSLFSENLKNILRLFQEAQIPVLLLKGAALIFTLYPKSALRPLGDLDLFVRVQDFDKAKHALLSVGCTIPASLPPVPATFLREITFISKPHGASIDLHASITAPPHFLSRYQKDWFWRNSEDISVGEYHPKVFKPEAQLLHLCSHLVHSEGGDLLNRYDIRELIRLRGEEIDWIELLRIGREFDLLIPLQQVLLELAEEWETPIPAGVLAKLKEMSPSRREKRIFQEPYGRESKNHIKRLWIELTGFRSIFDCLQYTWYRLFPVRDFMIRHYRAQNDILLPIAYVYRWFVCLRRKETG